MWNINGTAPINRKRKRRTTRRSARTLRFISACKERYGCNIILDVHAFKRLWHIPNVSLYCFSCPSCNTYKHPDVIQIGAVKEAEQHHHADVGIYVLITQRGRTLSTKLREMNIPLRYIFT